MSKTSHFFDTHHLALSEKKSKTMSFDSTTGRTTFDLSSDLPSITLDQVISFKYLGVPLSSSPYSLFKSYNEQVRQRANSYLARVMSIVKTGPDRSSLAYTLWTQVALPSILYGAEILPLTDGTISEIEKCQASVGKLILQLPRSSANVAVHIDAGLRPIWSIVAEKVLLYSHSTMSKSLSFWPKMAMNECMTLGQKSPYFRYVLKWKEKTESFDLTPTQIKKVVKKAAISSIIMQQKITSTTTFSMTPPGSSPSNQWFKPKSWVSDSGISQIFAQFRSCNAGFGNRGPAKNGMIYKLCPLCAKNNQKALNNEVGN